jgi:hypothetical protein
MITITGLTDLEQDIADEIWARDTVNEIDDYIRSLPKSLRPRARMVFELITAAVLDTHMEVGEDVKDYLSSR